MADGPTLPELVNGYRAAQAIHVAAVLGIADQLADGPRTADELADAVAANPDSLYRLLRALASVGVVEELDERRFALADLGQGLRSDTPGSLAGWAAYIGRPPFWDSWGALLHSVRTGENAFRHLHGESVWEYRAAQPEEQAVFDGAMAAITGAANRSVLDAYDFGRFAHGRRRRRRKRDAARRRARAPSRRPGRALRPAARRAAADECSRRCAGRCRSSAAASSSRSRRAATPTCSRRSSTTGRTPRRSAILRACREAMAPDATAPARRTRPRAAERRTEAKFSDLNMLVNPGGRERTYDEYGRLFEQAGLRLIGSMPSSSGWAVFEARAG